MACKPGELRVGDWVEWNSQGSRNACGKVIQIITNGQVPEVNYTIYGTVDDPVALIELYHPEGDGWVATGKKVAHKFSSLTEISALRAKEARLSNLNRLQKLQKRVQRWFAGLTQRANAREIKEVDEWDGAASNYASTEAYCNACLINVNLESDPETWTQSHCKLPVRGPGDGADVYVNKAVYAAAGGRGITAVTKPDDVSQDDWDAAVEGAAREIIAAYKEMGETAPESCYELAGMEMPEERMTEQTDRAMSMSLMSEQIWTEIMESNYYAWPIDLYVDGGNIFAIVTAEGKLYQVPVSLDEASQEVTLGEWVQVIEEFVPIPRSLRVTRQTDGRARWTSIASTAILNRMGEIDAMELFDDMIARVAEEGYPYLTFFHTDEVLKMGECDFLARDGVVYVASGLFDDTELGRQAAAGIEADPDYWGISIGFLPSEPPEMAEVMPGVKIPVYKRGVHKELSILPEQMAAAWFTTVNCMEVNRMKKEIAEALRKLIGNEEAEKWVTKVDGVNRAAEEDGMIRRDKTEPIAGVTIDKTEPAPPAPVVDPAPPAEPPAPAEVVLDDELVLQIARAAVEDETLRNLIKGHVETMAQAYLEGADVVRNFGAAAQEIATQLVAMEEAHNTGLETLRARVEEVSTDTSLKDEVTRLAGEVQKLVDAVGQIQGGVEALQADETERQQEWLNDLPERQTNRLRVSYRPSASRVVTGGQTTTPTMAEIAAQTLANIEGGVN